MGGPATGHEKVAQDRKIALAMRRSCAVCGYGMPAGTTAYRAFSQADAAHMRQFETEQSHGLGGPLHLSCILYSAMACPYLRERGARLGKDSEIAPGARRGTRAAIMGFRDFGMLIYAEPHNFLDPAYPPPHFAYLELLEDIGYRDGSELLERYEAAIESDAAIIDTTGPRLFWTDDPDELKGLGELLRSDFKKLNEQSDVLPGHRRAR